MRKFFEENGAVSRAGTPQDLATTIRRDLETAVQMVKATGIQAE